MIVNLFVNVGYDESVRIDSPPFVPASGTLLLTDVSVTLRDDATGLVAGGIDRDAATGFIDTASASPFAWQVIDPSALGLPVPNTSDVYTLEFLGTDSVGEKVRSVVGIVVLA